MYECTAYMYGIQTRSYAYAHKIMVYAVCIHVHVCMQVFCLNIACNWCYIFPSLLKMEFFVRANKVEVKPVEAEDEGQQYERKDKSKVS